MVMYDNVCHDWNKTDTFHCLLSLSFLKGSLWLKCGFEDFLCDTGRPQQEFIKFPGEIFQCNLYTYVRILVPRTSWRPLFEVLGHFWVLTTFLIIIAVTYSCPSGNDCNFRWFKAFKRESSNLLVNRKSPEVLKSRTSNPSSAVPPGPRAQAPRRLWEREWYVRRIGDGFWVDRP